MYNTPPLETERLFLRRFTEADAAPMLPLLSDPEVNTFLPWFPLETVEQVRKFLEERYFSLYRQSAGCGYAICRKSDNLPIGYMGVSPEYPYDFGYGLNREFWGKGFAVEAGRAVLAQAEAAGLPFLTATHDVKNPRSGAVMRRLGLTYRYSYVEQWKPKNVIVTFRMYQKNFTKPPDWVCQKYWEQYERRFVESGL